MLERDAVGGEAFDQVAQLLCGLGDRRTVEQLRADVAGDAGDAQVGQRGGAAVDVGASAKATPNLLPLEAGGDVGWVLGSTSGLTRSDTGAAARVRPPLRRGARAPRPIRR